MFCNGFNDGSFDAWAIEDEPIQTCKSGFNSPMTVDSDVKHQLVRQNSDQENCFLLVKNFPADITESEVWNLFQDCVFLEKVFILNKINNVYLKFTSTIEMQAIIATNEQSPMVYKEQKLKMCSVLKLPLDLNLGSKVLLLTIYDEKIEITAQTIYQIFKDSFQPARVIIFKKKNYQSFVEFDSIEESCAFKEKYDNMNFKGFFFLKVQFTKKDYLNITKNSAMEHDFTLVSNPKPRLMTADLNNNHFTFHPFNISPNLVPSLQNFDECPVLNDDHLELKDVCPDLTMDTSEDKTEFLYILTLINVGSEAKHKTLFNLFSLYGNIECISIDKDQKKATIFYLTEFEQMTAHHCLSGLSLFESPLTIIASKLPKLSQKQSNFKNIVNYKKILEAKRVNVLSKLRVINKPSSILYVFNLSSNASLDMVKQMFEEIVKVQNIYYSNESKNSALVFFNSIDEAVKVLCLFKNTNLVDKSLKINFANSNLLKGKEQAQERKKSKFISLQSFNECATFLDFDSPLIEPKKSKLNAKSSAFKVLRKPFCG